MCSFVTKTQVSKQYLYFVFIPIFNNHCSRWKPNKYLASLLRPAPVDWTVTTANSMVEIPQNDEPTSSYRNPLTESCDDTLVWIRHTIS
jgi:hypothetical protein